MLTWCSFHPCTQLTFLIIHPAYILEVSNLLGDMGAFGVLGVRIMPFKWCRPWTLTFTAAVACQQQYWVLEGVTGRRKHMDTNKDASCTLPHAWFGSVVSMLKIVKWHRSERLGSDVPSARPTSDVDVTRRQYAV